MKAKLAKLLRGAADRLAPQPSPTPGVPTITLTASAISDDDFLNDLILRDALRRALNRYQPFRPPAQA